MKSYSLGRVFQYARYHYSALQSKYMTRLLILAGLPLLVGVYDSSSSAAIEFMSFLYFFVALAVATLSVYPMRARGMRVLEMGIPVSNAERMTFLMLNLVVVYPLVAHILAGVVVTIVSLLDKDVTTVAEAMEKLFMCGFVDWWYYISCQVFAAGVLLINLLARRSLFVAYLIAFLCFTALFSCLGWALEMLTEMDIIYDNTIDIALEMFDNVIEPILKVVYSLLPASIYAICYAILRKRQLNW